MKIQQALWQKALVGQPETGLAKQRDMLCTRLWLNLALFKFEDDVDLVFPHSLELL